MMINSLASCEPVTWQECDLVAKEVTFIVPEISCRDKAEGVWYHEPGPVTRTKEAARFTCSARSSVSCVTEVRPVCKVARWQDCAEVPVPSCRPKSVHVPTQVCRYRYRYYLHTATNISAPAGVSTQEEVSSAR